MATEVISEGKSSNIKLLLGPYRCGKTAMLIDQLVALKIVQQLADVLLLVPSARYARILKERIRARLRDSATKAGTTKDAGIFGLEIQPFYQCCLKVLSKAGKIPRVIPEEIRPALMTRLLAEMKAQGELSSLSTIAEFHGTGVSVLELIDELQRAGLTPEEVITRLENSSCQESHLLELARVYERYWKHLQSLDYFDQKSLALKAREELFSRKQLEYDLVIIDGFDRVSHLQAQVFAGLSRRARATKIAFDYAFRQDFHENDSSERAIIMPNCGSQHAQPAQALTKDPRDQTGDQSALRQSCDDYRWKDGSYDELVLNLQPEVILTDFPAMASGSSLQVDNASNPQKFLPGVEAISLLDPFLEMAEISRQIKSALTERHVLPSELIVVTRSPEAYSGAIEAAFEDAGIGYFIDGSSKVSDLEPWRFIRNLLSLSANNFKRKDLIDLLRSPFMNLEALGMTAEDVSSLDRRSYEFRLIGGEKSWHLFLNRNENLSYSSQVLAFLSELQQQDAPASAGSHARRIEDLVEKYMRFPGRGSKQHGTLECNERETIKALRRCLQVLMLQESLLCQDMETFTRFFNRLKSLIEKASYARPRPQTPAVTICSAELVPNMLFKEIYLCGVIEGNFPKHQTRAGFLGPDQVSLWLSFGIDIRNPRQEPGFERAIFYSLTERAGNRLFLSLPQFNSQGDETLVSFYIDELSEKTGLSCHRAAPFSNSTAKPVSVREALSSALWQNGIKGAAVLALSQESISRRWLALRNSVAALLARAKSQPENLFNGYLSDFFESGTLVLPEPNIWTASKINDYGKCPFRFWATHVLSLKPREEAETGLNPALVGQFYHKVLEFFFSDMSKKELHNKMAEPDIEAYLNAASLQAGEPERQTYATANLIDAAFEKGLAWIEHRADFQAGPYWQQEQNDLRFRINRFIERELLRIESSSTAYHPSFFEVNFGRELDNSFPALLLRSEDGTNILVRGTIDRIDLAADGLQARIVDYKSGSKTISAKEAEQGRNLQLPIYALALEQCIRPGSFVAEADYLSVNVARAVGSMDFRSAKHAELKALARQFVQDYTAAVNRGIFTVKPSSREACKDCPQTTSCRVAELRTQMTEETDASAD